LCLWEDLMGPFFDLHSHILFGVDDGAENQETMFAMLDVAYEDGIRAICLTPHCSPYHYGDTFARSEKSFEIITAYAQTKYPDLSLFLGHELGYYYGCEDVLRDGICRTLAGSRYVLVDFPAHVDFFELSGALNRLRGMGYRTVLAHVERYRCLLRRVDWIRGYVEAGGLIQLNASTITRKWGSRRRKLWIRLVRERLVHFIASDGHDLALRSPKMSVCMEYLQKHCDPEYVRELTWENGWRIVKNAVF